MPRLKALEPHSVTARAADLFRKIEARLGKVPNMMRTMAHSAPVLDGYLSLDAALSGGALPPRVREQIALAVAEANGCQYCLAAHTVLGAGAGLSQPEIDAAREAGSAEPKTEAILRFARLLAAGRGEVSDSEFAAVRSAGASDAEIAETIANVALNILTNYFNKAANVEVDFPAVARLHSRVA